MAAPPPPSTTLNPTGAPAVMDVEEEEAAGLALANKVPSMSLLNEKEVRPSNPPTHLHPPHPTHLKPTSNPSQPTHPPHQLLRQHREAGRRTIQNFLKSHKCYDVLRQSGKVVVFDTNIPFQLAFYALVEHGRWVGGWVGGWVEKMLVYGWVGEWVGGGLGGPDDGSNSRGAVH